MTQNNRNQKLKVLKFGGTSMGSRESLKKVVQIIQQNFEAKQQQVVVCSAMSGVTDKLFAIGDLAEKSEKVAALKMLKEIKKMHFDVAQKFSVAETFRLSIDPIFKDLENLIKGLSLIHELSLRSKAYLTAFGEKLSTRLLAEILKTQLVTAVQVDSNFIRTMGANLEEADVDWEVTQESVKLAINPFLKNNQVPVVTGFFGTNDKGVISLLGRGGSDFSGAILTVCLGGKHLEIWTDVDGFMSADPRVVKDAELIDEIGFTEASELCSFGAKVLHPKTIRPVIDNGGEVFIKNTFNHTAVGTRIADKINKNCHSVVSITTKSALILSLDIFGVALGKHKSKVFLELFSVIEKYGVLIDAIASSESLISFCVEEKYLKQKRFLADLEKVAPLSITPDRKIICVVSPQAVQGKFGIAADFFRALGDEKISVEMYSQNNAEIAQLMVVKKEDADRGVRAIHQEFTKGNCSLKFK